MATFSASDGTRLAYRSYREGEPVLCIPGGPADSRYLGDLGGLSAHRRLIVPDLRGTGRSAVPEDPATRPARYCRCPVLTGTSASMCAGTAAYTSLTADAKASSCRSSGRCPRSGPPGSRDVTTVGSSAARFAPTAAFSATPRPAWRPACGAGRGQVVSGLRTRRKPCRPWRGFSLSHGSRISSAVGTKPASPRRCAMRSGGVQ